MINYHLLYFLFKELLPYLYSLMYNQIERINPIIAIPINIILAQKYPYLFSKV